MASSKAPFALTRATASDMDELVALQYRCFPEFIRLVFMGCHSEADLPRIRDRYIKVMDEDPSDIWIKVTDAETGKIIAASNWKVYTTKPTHGVDETPEWLEGEEREKSARLVKRMNEIREKAMPGPYIHLHICFTDDAYRRRGAGGMMLQWGVDLADQLFIPGWIEASEEGNFLYKTFGFYDSQKLDAELAGTCMKRDVRTTPIEGGKAKAG